MAVITTAPESLLAAIKQGGLEFGGTSFVAFQAGTHGQFYDSTINRYAKRVQSSGGGGGGYFIFRNMGFEPRALLDPKYGPFSGILRARECMAVTMPNGIPVTGVAQSVESFWGFGGTQGGGAFYTNASPFIGFRQRAKWAATTGAVLDANVWHAVVVNDALVTLYDLTTAISPLAPHEFEIIFDGTTSTVGFYIDSVLVGSYTFASGVAPGQVTPYANVGASAADRWNMVWASANVGFSGVGPFITNFLYGMSPYTIVTLETAD